MIESLSSTLVVPKTALLPGVRSLHLVDVENLLGGANFDEREAAAAAAAYGPVADLGETDLVVVASSHHAASATWFGWRNARRVVQSGPDGADRALIKIIETENIPARFERVVIASGDQIFAEPAARLQTLGVTVTVVSRPESLSRHLRFAVRDVRYLRLLPNLGPIERTAA
jgi:hypothetical protein